MTASIQNFQANDPFSGSTNVFNDDLKSKLNMLFALTQQQLTSSSSTSSSPLDCKAKRIKKSIDLPTQVPLVSATESTQLNYNNEREMVKVVTTAGPQTVDKDFLTQLLIRKDVIPARKRRDFIPNDMKDDQYWERRRKNNLAAKRSREKRRLNDIVLETKVVELTNENEALKAKLNLMLSRLNMKESEMEHLFEEEQRLGHISVKTISSFQTATEQNDDNSKSIHETMPINMNESEQSNIQQQTINSTAVDLTRNDIKATNIVTRKTPSPLTPSPSPSNNESLLQILANQMLKTKQQDQLSTATSTRLLKIASPIEQKSSTSKRNYQEDDDNEQKNQWDEAAMTLLSLNKQPPVEQQVALQSVINGLLRKPNPPKATIDYHTNNESHQMQGENIHHNSSFEQWKTLMNYFTMPTSTTFHSQQNESRADMMPLKLRMKMLNAKS